MESVESRCWDRFFGDFHLSVAPAFVSGYLAIVLVMAGAFLMHFAPGELDPRAQRIVYTYAADHSDAGN